MKKTGSFFTILSITLVIAPGCSSDRVLMMTKTNVGLDIDSRPPTAEITIARRELAIQPTFPVNHGVKNGDSGPSADNENHSDEELSLPLLAAFGLEGNFINPRITGQFAGGDAAYLLAKEKLDENETIDNTLCLETEPADSRNWLRKLITPTEVYKQEARQFYFATDTSYGLKVAWSGTAGPYPDSLKLGYNRKEFASPPVYADKGCTKGRDGWTVKLPSFIATTDNATGWEIVDVFNVFSGKAKHIQFFATGKAATELAKRKSVRQAALMQMSPAAAKIEAATKGE